MYFRDSQTLLRTWKKKTVCQLTDKIGLNCRADEVWLAACLCYAIIYSDSRYSLEEAMH